MIRSYKSPCVMFCTMVLVTSCKRPNQETYEYRAELYESCAQCHGPEGLGKVPPNPENDLSGFGVPSIAGLESWYISSQLRKFRRGQRGFHERDSGGKRMEPMSRTLSTDGDVDLIASYVASLPKKTIAPTLKGGSPEAGRALYTPCAACHGESAEGDFEQRAQHSITQVIGISISNSKILKTAIEGPIQGCNRG